MTKLFALIFWLCDIVRKKDSVRILGFHELGHRETHFLFQIVQIYGKRRLATTDEVVAFCEERFVFIHKPLFLTFDDGFRSQEQFARLISHQLGASAGICFVIPSLVSERDASEQKKILGFSSSHNLKDVALEIGKLRTSSLDVGYHTYNHSPISQVVKEDIKYDFVKCTKFYRENHLEKRLHKMFCLPFGTLPPEGHEKRMCEWLFQSYDVVVTSIRGINKAGSRLLFRNMWCNDRSYLANILLCTFIGDLLYGLRKQNLLRKVFKD